MLLSETLERVRTLAASVDGSFLDDDTWRTRHFYVLLTACALALFTLVSAIAKHHGSDQWVYVAVETVALPFAAIHRLPRRVQEALVAVSFVAGLIFATRYAGNFGLGPLALIVLTFYQDWVAVAIGLAATAALLVLAGVDPAFFSGSPDFANDPLGVMAIRATAIGLAAVLALASGLKVVAEGVENAEQRDMLLSIKPDMLAQGWLYARALPVDEFETWVLDRKRAPVA